MDETALAAVTLLAEPARRALYAYVTAAVGEVGRDEAAAAVGVSRSLAAFHLDKLVAAGLLAVSFRRLSGRSGPGAGRPAKLYRRTDTEHAVSLPPRGYATAAALLAEAVDKAGLEPQLQAAARQAGTAAGRALPATVDLTEVLTARGYEPVADGREIRLRNCPFQALARQFPPLICGMNLALLDGLLAGWSAGEGWSAQLHPRPGECCVSLFSNENSD